MNSRTRRVPTIRLKRPMSRRPRLRRRLFLRLPRPLWFQNLIIRRKMWRDDARESELHKRLVDRENEVGKLRDGEDLHLAGVWVTELYLPSNVQSLIDGIDQLGWRQGRFGGDEDVVEWIKSARSRPGGWRSLGFVVTPEQSHFMATHKSSLPTGMRAAFPHVFSVSNGLSALVILFVPDEPTSTALTGLLNRSYGERTVPLPLACIPVSQ